MPQVGFDDCYGIGSAIGSELMQLLWVADVSSSEEGEKEWVSGLVK